MWPFPAEVSCFIQECSYVRNYVASVLFPTCLSLCLEVINLIVRASRFAVARSVGLPTLVSKWLPTAAGLGSVPFIIKPIDDFVDFSLDNSTRKFLEQK